MTTALETTLKLTDEQLKLERETVTRAKKVSILELGDFYIDLFSNFPTKSISKIVNLHKLSYSYTHIRKVMRVAENKLIRQFIADAPDSVGKLYYLDTQDQDKVRKAFKGKKIYTSITQQNLRELFEKKKKLVKPKFISSTEQKMSLFKKAASSRITGVEFSELLEGHLPGYEPRPEMGARYKALIYEFIKYLEGK